MGPIKGNQTSHSPREEPEEDKSTMDLGGIQVDRNKYPTLQRNASQVKENPQILPKPIMVKVLVDRHPALGITGFWLVRRFYVVHSSRPVSSKKNIIGSTLGSTVGGPRIPIQGERYSYCSVTVPRIKEDHTFNIIILNNYDIILGTPWMHQHQICIGFNPARIIVGSEIAQPLKLGTDTKRMVHSVTMKDQDIEVAREELCQYAAPLCKEVLNTELPPFQNIKSYYSLD